MEKQQETNFIIPIGDAMIRNIKQYINHSSLERKLALIVSAIIILVISTFSVLSFEIVKSRYETMLYRSMATSASLITHELTDSLSDVDLLSDMIRSDRNVQKHLDLIYQNADYKEEKSYDQLYNAQQNYFQQYKKDYLAYSAIINPAFISYTYGYGYIRLSDEMIGRITDAATAQKGRAVWVSDYTEENYLFLARQIKKIDNLELSNLGVLAIAVDMDGLLDEITQESRDFQHIDWIFSENGEVVHASPALKDVSSQKLGLQLDLLPDTYGPVVLNGRSYFCLRGHLASPSWDYCQLIPYDELAKSQKTLLSSYVVIFLFSLGLTICLIHISIRRMTADIGVLLRKIQSFRGDNAETITVPYDYSGRTDEIGLLHQYFDHMAGEIQTLINHDYKLNIEMKDMQLKSLEAQINPHFLYNTLESINWRAKAAGNDEISRMVESLGTLLRATLSKKESLVPFSEELELVNCYLTIQKIRYEERLSYEIDISDTLEHLLLPPLSIQPLVENAIKYGLEEIVEQCRILISARRIGGKDLLIEVKNNGSYFEDHLLEKLKASERTAQGFGIGLINIDQRMKLLFGVNYGVLLYNKDGFAVAALRLPVSQTKKGETYAETDDCG